MARLYQFSVALCKNGLQLSWVQASNFFLIHQTRLLKALQGHRHQILLVRSISDSKYIWFSVKPTVSSAQLLAIIRLGCKASPGTHTAYLSNLVYNWFSVQGTIGSSSHVGRPYLQTLDQTVKALQGQTLQIQSVGNVSDLVYDWLSI